MKLIITAGGGGHFAPALSLIKALPKDVDFLVVGRKYAFEGDTTIALEYRTAKAMNIPFETIAAARLQRSFTRHTIPSLSRLPVGFTQARKILRSYRPDVVMSFGGYVSLPVTLAAYSLRIPVVIHEQTLRAGMANKIAAKLARKICLSWEESIPYFPKGRTVVTGNPLREEILSSAQTSEDPFNGKSYAKPLIYITGGSLGSHALNMIVKDSLGELLKSYTLFHQTGDAQEFGDFDILTEKKMGLPEDLKDRYILTKFVNPASVGALIRSADLVVARSGMTTVAELIYLNKPALLIPLPTGQSKEQYTNAKFFEALGLGRTLEQEKLSKQVFIEAVQQMIDEKDQYSIPESRRKELIREDAAGTMKDILLDVYKEKSP